MDAEASISQAEGPELRAQLVALTERVRTLEYEMARLRGANPVPDIPVAPPPPPLVAAVAASHDASPLASHEAPSLPPFTKPQPESASLEKRLGSHIFNRIGIVALLIGSAWFLKLAIDNRWIGPVGRVLVGLLTGAAIIAWSERFRRRAFASFSYSLKAVGTGVLYLSLWAAFQLYHLLPASAALLAMLLIAAWNAFMAWSQDAELLAAYALAGAMLTPGLLSTGGNHEIFLFTYLLGIDLASVVLVRLKRWPRLLAGAFPATVAYVAAWFGRFYTASEIAVTAVFVVALAAVFVAASLGSQTEERDPRDSFGSYLRQIILPLANGSFVAFILYRVFSDAGHHDTTAWIMLALAALYLAVLRLPQPRITAGVHLSLAVVLLSIAIPLKAEGRWITVGWLVEGVALLLLARNTGERHAQTSARQPSRAFAPVLASLSFAALAFGCCGALLQLYVSRHFEHAFLNPRFATALLGVAAMAAATLITRSSPASLRLSSERTAAVLNIATNLLAVLAGVREIEALWQDASGAEAQLQMALAVSAFLMGYGAVLLATGFVKRSAFLRWQALALIVFTILKTFVYDMRNLSQGYRVVSFLALGVLLMAVSFAYQKDWLSLRETESAP